MYNGEEEQISVPCPAGTNRSADQTSCEKCVENTISTEGADSCTPCDTGFLANRNKTKCGTFFTGGKQKLGLFGKSNFFSQNSKPSGQNIIKISQLPFLQERGLTSQT